MRKLEETLFEALSMDQELCDLLAVHVDQIFNETENRPNLQKNTSPCRVNRFLKLKREFRQNNGFGEVLNKDLSLKNKAGAKNYGN